MALPKDQQVTVDDLRMAEEWLRHGYEGGPDGDDLSNLTSPKSKCTRVADWIVREIERREVSRRAPVLAKLQQTARDMRRNPNDPKVRALIRSKLAELGYYVDDLPV